MSSKMKHAKILIVDDQEAIQSALSRILKDENFNVETCSNGEEALQKISQGEYDLLVTDLAMPQRDGYSLLADLEQIRQDSGVAQKAVIITGTDPKAVKQKMRDHNLAGIFLLYKPFRRNEFLDTITEALNHSIF